MIGRALIALFALAAAAGPAIAQDCDADRDARIRALLDRERHNARLWNVGWGIGFGVVAGAQVGMAATEWAPFKDVDHAFETSLWIGAGKSTIGLLSRIVVPLDIPRPAAGGDPCASLAASERALATAARNEKQSVILNAAGGVALNVAGALYIGLEADSWADAAASLGTGLVVTALGVYTQPRTSWRRGVPVAPTVSWTPVAFPRGLGIAGTF